MRPGTTITFAMDCSPTYWGVFSWPRTWASTSAGLADAGASRKKRVLPLKETGYLTVLSAASSSLYSGKAA